MKHCRCTCNRRRFVASHVQYRAGRIASREGWTAHELIGTRTYGLLHRSKTAVLEKITYNGMFALIACRYDLTMPHARLHVDP